MPELFEDIVENVSDGLGVGDAGGAERGAGGEGQVDEDGTLDAFAPERAPEPFDLAQRLRPSRRGDDRSESRRGRCGIGAATRILIFPEPIACWTCLLNRPT